MTGEGAGGPVPVYTFGVRLNQAPTTEQDQALRQICSGDRWTPDGQGALLRCTRQAESLPAAIASAFGDIAQVSGLVPYWVDTDPIAFADSPYERPLRTAAHRAE